jgi:demethylmenaquinone methyltransferase/2-methoxy-6-polyprenyl-1,4-benzoquinol methylase
MSEAGRNHPNPAPAAPSDALIPPEENRRMFEQVARRYDLLNALLSLGLDRRWRREAVAMLAPQQGGRFLDAGCGTGDVSLELLRQAPGATVVGIDPAQAMLVRAAAKAARAGLGERAVFQTGDVTALDFADGSFAGVITAFCFRNVSARGQALAEMKRVLVPGGRLVILELTVPAGRVLRCGHRCYSCLAPLLGRVFSHGSAYRYLVDSIRDFPRAAEIVALLDQAGFRQGRHVPLTGGVVTVFAAENVYENH